MTLFFIHFHLYILNLFFPIFISTGGLYSCHYIKTCKSILVNIDRNKFASIWQQRYRACTSGSSFLQGSTIIQAVIWLSLVEESSVTATVLWTITNSMEAQACCSCGATSRFGGRLNFVPSSCQFKHKSVNFTLLWKYWNRI